MHHINVQVLEVVRPEFELELEECAALMPRLVENHDPAAAMALANKLDRLSGVFKLLELSGAAELCAAMSGLVRFWNDADHKDNISLQPLLEAQQLLSEYLNYALQREYDNVLILLPEINALRAQQNLPVYSESQFLSQLLPEKAIVGDIAAKTPEQLLIVRRARQLFQQGLLNCIRGNSRNSAAKVMAYGVARLQHALTNQDELLYWSLVEEVLKCLARDELAFDKSRIKSLMGLERQLAMLGKGSDLLNQCYPELLQRIMASYLSLSGSLSDEAEAIRARLQITATRVSDQQIQADRALLTATGEVSFGSMMSVLSDNLDELRQILDLLSESPQTDNETREQLLSCLLAVGETCSMTGFALASMRFVRHAEQCSNLGTDLPYSIGLIQDMADSVLYLECVLIELNNQVPTDHQLQQFNQKTLEEVVEANIVSHAGRLVLAESKEKLANVMRLTSDFCDGLANPEAKADLQDNFRMVKGAASILGLDRAAAIAVRCLGLIQQGMLEDLSASKTSVMNTFADIIVSLEYYLDSCRWSQSADDALLAVAEECLQKLEV